MRYQIWKIETDGSETIISEKNTSADAIVVADGFGWFAGGHYEVRIKCRTIYSTI